MKIKVPILIIFLFLIVFSIATLNPVLSGPNTNYIRDGDYIYIDNSKAYLKGSYSVTHGEDIEHWAMTKNFMGDCDMAIGFDGRVAWPTKVLLEDWHYENSTSNQSKTFYNVTNFSTTTDEPDYGNPYNIKKYKFDHKIHIEYDNITNESIWQDIIGTVAYFDSQENDGTNYTITWHTKHSRLEQYRDISDRILSNPVNYEFDGKNLWFITKNIPMTANEMRKIVIEMDGKMEWGPGNTYKYDIIWWPSHQTIAEAIAAGNLYVLDPLWNSSYDIRLKMPINNTAGAGAQTYFQVGTNLSAYDVNASSLRCYNRTSGAIIYHWNESVVNGNVYELWTNNTNIADGWDENYFCSWQSTPTASGSASGINTFLQYHGSASSNFLDSQILSPSNIAYEGKVRITSSSHNILWGVSNSVTTSDDALELQTYDGNLRIVYARNEGTSTGINEAPQFTLNQWYKIKITNDGTTVYGYVDGDEINTGGISTNLPDENLGLWFFIPVGTGEQEWSFARKYNTTPPVYENLVLEYYADSLHYNATQEVNNTIYSNPAEIALNRTAVAGDNTNWTANGSANWIFTTAVTPGGYTNFSIIGTIDNFTTWNLTASTQYDLKNASGTVEQQTTNTDGNATFEVDLVSGDYWIESGIAEYIPPDPINLANSTHNFGVNYTFEAGAGNVTDSYNISTNNGSGIVWDNGSSVLFSNTSTGAHGYVDFVVYAYNNSGTGTLSAGSLSDNVTVLNNVITISNVSGSYILNEGDTLYIDANYVDDDGDTGDFGDNSSDWNVDTSTGVVSWVAVDGDDGVYNWYINVSDGYGSIDTQAFTVTVNNSIYPPTVELLSQDPSEIYQNSTGYMNISYGITHDSSGLNNTSVSFIYHNHDQDLDDTNHSIRVPDNNRAAEWNLNGRVLRGLNRNNSLNFEDNDTITGGDIYSWSGMDENISEVTIIPVNSTYTKVNINGTIHQLMPDMWYIDRGEMIEAPKTLMGIHKSQDILVKFWDFEIFKGNYDFIGVGYTDTALHTSSAHHPSDANPVSVYYLNSSYDPVTGGDPLTSGYAVFMLSLNVSEWVDHDYSPHANSTYVRGFINNSLLHSLINTTEISYLYYKSETPSSKPFYLNVTNVATTTNVSFNNTNVLWAGNSAPYTQQAYTPNVWFAFMKDNMTFDHKLYVADNNDQWGNSTLSTTTIGEALFPPTKPFFNAFHFDSTSDYDMNGTYSYIDSICIGVGSDPDGGDVTHNVTLHYSDKTYVDTLNNTLTNKDIVHNDVYAHVDFDVTQYSTLYNYTLRVIATDDEGENVTTWLGVNFSINLDNFTFSNEAISPTVVRENKPFTVSVDINDSDGTIADATVKISGTNYTMTAGSGDTWSYVFTDTSLPTEYYVQNFYATDNDGDTNSTTSTMTIDVLSSAGTGSGGGIRPVETPTPTPTPVPVIEPEVIPEPVEDIGKNVSEIIERIIFKDKITIFRFNLKTEDRLYLKEMLIANMTNCTFTSEIINYCNVQDEIVSLTVKFDPDKEGFLYHHEDYINLYDNTYLYHTEFDIYVINFMATIDVFQNDIQNPSKLFFGSSEFGTISGIRIWWILMMIIIAGVVYYWRRKK